MTGAFGLAAAAAVVAHLTGVAPRTQRVLAEAEAARRRKPARGPSGAEGLRFPLYRGRPTLRLQSGDRAAAGRRSGAARL